MLTKDDIDLIQKLETVRRDILFCGLKDVESNKQDYFNNLMFMEDYNNGQSRLVTLYCKRG